MIGSIYGMVFFGMVVMLISMMGIMCIVIVGVDGKYNMVSLLVGSYMVEVKGFFVCVVIVIVGGGMDVFFFNNLEMVIVIGFSICIVVIDISQMDICMVFIVDVLFKIVVGCSVNQVVLLVLGVFNSVSYNMLLMIFNLNNLLGCVGVQNIGSFGGLVVFENVYYINGYFVINLLLNIGVMILVFDFIGQVQVFIGGYGVEYGCFIGGVVSLIMKCGINEWKGGVYVIWSLKLLCGDLKDFYYIDIGNWSQVNYYNFMFGNKFDNWIDGMMYQCCVQNMFNGLSYGVWVSGLIIKDCLFIYVNIE